MIPIWKLRRELDRLGQKFRSWIEYPIEGVRQRAYDRAFPSQLTITQGASPTRPAIAIFLIFQPNDILKSTLRECQHLIDEGFAPLIVSNCPLTPESRAALSPVAWQIVERPNYGYDFGGYRDGVRLLRHLSVAPKSLLILNDSIWFPLHDKSQVLKTLQAKAANVTGIVYHEDIVRRSALSTRKAFLESYFFLFDETALAAPAFDTYWDSYRVSSNKLNAVYRGERALCDAMRAGGLVVEGLIDRQSLLDTLTAQTPEFLRKTLEYGAYTDAEFATSGATLLAQFRDDVDWHTEALAHVTTVTRKRNLHASFCYASMTLFGLASIKKSTGTFLKRTYGTLHAETRTQYLRAVTAGDLPAPYPEIVPEIEARQVANASQN